MSDIKLVTFKTSLINIIGEVSEAFSVVTIKQPCQVVMQNSQDTGQVSVGFVPMLVISDEWSTGITIPKSEVLVITTPILDIRNKYSEAFGSGFTIARNMPGKIQTN